MATITFDFHKQTGRIKPMHAVNNGPVRASKVEQTRGNFEAYKAAGIPYARTHDASFYAGYGGEHTVDVHAVFPDFGKNPYDPASYDFTLTDGYLETIVDAGTEVFYRLGSKIEHWPKKYGTIVPADFRKWAVICEHIIRHYTQGWANGFHYRIIYWEIWNEPDGVKTNGDQPNWSGTAEEFYELYVTAAAHLKSRFPHLKIGGPAMSWLEHREWLDGFLEALTRGGKKVPLDFFSWHVYTTDPRQMAAEAVTVREILDRAGYPKTECHLNEYNYLEDWTDRFIASIEGIISERGAAFSGAVMSVMQDSPLDMLMYYDARPTAFNGLFDFYTMRPLKGYYPFRIFSRLYELGIQVQTCSDDSQIYVTAAGDGTKEAAMITCYSADRQQTEPKEICLCGLEKKYHFYLVDAEHTMMPLDAEQRGTEWYLTMQPDSILFLESV